MDATCTVYYEMTESWSKDKTTETSAASPTTSSIDRSKGSQKKNGRPAKKESIILYIYI